MWKGWSGNAHLIEVRIACEKVQSRNVRLPTKTSNFVLSGLWIVNDIGPTRNPIVVASFSGSSGEYGCFRYGLDQTGAK